MSQVNNLGEIKQGESVSLSFIELSGVYKGCSFSLIVDSLELAVAWDRRDLCVYDDGDDDVKSVADYFVASNVMAS